MVPIMQRITTERHTSDVRRAMFHWLNLELNPSLIKDPTFLTLTHQFLLTPHTCPWILRISDTDSFIRSMVLRDAHVITDFTVKGEALAHDLLNSLNRKDYDLFTELFQTSIN